MWLGVRCWRDKLALVAVQDGSPPTVAFARRQAAPDVEAPGERAAWFARAVTEAIEETDCAGVSVRLADADADQERARKRKAPRWRPLIYLVAQRVGSEGRVS
jgi:hypothetical protein